MDKCPFCGSVKVKEMSSSSGLHELFDCHTIFVRGTLYDKRHITCYETEITRLKELVRECEPLLRYLASLPPSILPFGAREYRANAMGILIRPDVRAIMGRKKHDNSFYSH